MYTMMYGWIKGSAGAIYSTSYRSVNMIDIYIVSSQLHRLYT